LTRMLLLAHIVFLPLGHCEGACCLFFFFHLTSSLSLSASPCPLLPIYTDRSQALSAPCSHCLFAISHCGAWACISGTAVIFCVYIYFFRLFSLGRLLLKPTALRLPFTV
jgi:hypothetical protein